MENKDIVGITWVERNVCIVDVKVIQECMEEGSISSSMSAFNRAICITIIHELRHLLLETNILLDDNEYPSELSEEDAVEEYGIDVYEHNPKYILCDVQVKSFG